MKLPKYKRWHIAVLFALWILKVGFQRYFDGVRGFDMLIMKTISYMTTPESILATLILGGLFLLAPTQEQK